MIRATLFSVFKRCFCVPSAYIKKLIAGCCFLTSLGLPAQNPRDSAAVDLSKVLTHKSLYDESFYTTIKRDSMPEKDIVFLKISQKIPEPFSDNIPISVVERNVLLSFNLSREVIFFLAFTVVRFKYSRFLRMIRKNWSLSSIRRIFRPV